MVPSVRPLSATVYKQGGMLLPLFLSLFFVRLLPLIRGTHLARISYGVGARAPASLNNSTVEADGAYSITVQI